MPRRARTTTPASDEAISLPDCTQFPEDVISDDLLDLVDSAALIRALAEQGVAGAQALLDDLAKSDTSLAARIARLRERLRRQASRRVGRVDTSYQERLNQLDLVQRRSKEEIEAEIQALEARLKAARAVDFARLASSEFLPEVTDALLIPTASWMQPEERPSIWARIKAFFARIGAWFRRLFGGRRSAPETKEPGARPFSFATLAANGRALGPSQVGEALARLSPAQRDELKDRVEDSIESKERDLRRGAEAKRKEAEAQQRALEAEREEARRRAESEVDSRVRAAEQARVERELKERGFVAERGGELVVTYGLVERFARLVLEEESRQLPGDVRLALKGGAATGVYEKAQLRQPDEVAHLDVVSSLLAARMEGSRHIDERSSFVYREITSERVHVVLAFDKSGSMAELGKLEAAKKALLALYVAIRRKHPDATVDVLAFENDVQVLDLVELWECKPGSFTNTAEALRTAHLLLQSSRANRREVYLITDGLPEAYTDMEGRVHSGNLDAAMEHALARAEELATVTPLKFSMVLLKSEHPEYEMAARAITRVLSGELIVTDPQHLGVELLVRWARGTETTRRAPASAAPPA
ncbi:MAG: hypothetical protein WAN77_01815, partial [Thermoplasmata archaeon]